MKFHEISKALARHANTVGGQPVFELFATQTDQKPEARRTVDRAMSPFYTKTDFAMVLWT